MADSFILNLDAREHVDLTLSGYPSSRVSMRIRNASGISLLPGETLTAMIVPSSSGITPAVASGMLLNRGLIDRPSEGLLTYRLQNTRTSKWTGSIYKILSFQDYDFENIPFDLHWIQTLSGQPNWYDNYTGVYSYPHNLQPGEVSMEMEPISGQYVRYSIQFLELNNSGDVLYSGAHQPYQFGFYYYNAGDKTASLTGVINGSPYVFGYNEVSGFAPPNNTGITFELPIYDPRSNNEAEATYRIQIGYMGATGNSSILLNIKSDHDKFLHNILQDLETKISGSFDQTGMQKVGEILIPKNTITRNRLSIGIKDIVVNKNTYNKQGVYISPWFISEKGVYTFSLKVKETIPAYPGIDPYSTVKYFVDFNNLGWEQISPLSRNQELDELGNPIPKLLILDKDIGDHSANVRYLDYTTNITNFRLRIVFDITAVEGQPIPPEIKDYRCVVFDKTQLLEI